MRNLLALSKSDDSRAWLAKGFVVSTLLAPFMAAHTLNPPADTNVVLGTVYWFFRMTAGFALYAGATLLLETTPLKRWGGWIACMAAASVATLVPFVMVITMLDLAVGIPEMSETVGDTATIGVFAWLARECLYISDNHLIYCLIVTLPRIWNLPRAAELGAGALPTGGGAETVAPRTAPAAPAAGRREFMQYLKPSLSGDLRYIEAQEHYIRVMTTAGSGMALYRFGDALRDLQGEDGIQVHRSFWVARDVVRAVERDRTGVRLKLDDGVVVPVSRRYERDVRIFFKDHFA